jgi:hypothetical protein
MFKMFAILCVLSSADCRVMYEDPPRLFETRADCEAAAVIKFQETQMIMQGTQYHSLDVGCEVAGQHTRL